LHEGVRGLRGTVGSSYGKKNVFSENSEDIPERRDYYSGNVEYFIIQ
jgi:hypothetical protein